MDKTCLWHKCEKGSGGSRATFTASRRDQDFCSSSCRLARANWRRIRGSILVDPLIAGDTETLESIRAELIKETT